MAQGSTPEERRLKAELEQCRESLRDLQYKYDRLIAEYEEALKALEQLTTPPFSWAVVQRVFVEQKRERNGALRQFVRCEVRLANGQLEKVGVFEEGVSQDVLKPGIAVWLNENHAIVDVVVPPQLFLGERATVVRKLSDEQLLIRQQETETTAWIHASLRDKNFEPDTPVLVDRSSRTVFAILPQEERVREFVMEEVPDVSFEDIGGLDEQIREIHEFLIYPIQYAALYEFNNVPFPQGGVLWGPPGNGKTLLAKAIARALGRKFYVVSGPELERWLVGQTEYLIRGIFQEANRQPSLVFFDDAESFLRRRGADIHSHKDDNVSQFISLIGGLKSFKNVIVLLATNRVDMIDPAILRPERLGDLKILIPSPNREAARSILSKHLKPGVAIEGMARDDAGIAAKISAMIDELVDYLYKHSSRTRFAKVYFDNGDNMTLYFDAVVSGAILANIARKARRKVVQRAKRYADELISSGARVEDALRASIDAEERGEIGLRMTDLIEACDEEFTAAAALPLTLDAIKSWAKMKGIMHEVVNFLPLRSIGGAERRSS
jgi:proteasome-associated ATPase